MLESISIKTKVKNMQIVIDYFFVFDRIRKHCGFWLKKMKGTMSVPSDGYFEDLAKKIAKERTRVLLEETKDSKLKTEEVIASEMEVTSNNPNQESEVEVDDQIENK